MPDRKLIRPSITETERMTSRTVRRKQVPAEQTNAESFYYLKQMQNRTPMVVVLVDGTELQGWIEWYDKSCIKLNRSDEPNLLLFKHAIRFMFKEEELRGRRRRRPRPKPVGDADEKKGRKKDEKTESAAGDDG